MYIIDKNKDYYDYYSHLYGVDKKITFDRRGSYVLSDESIVNMSNERELRPNDTTHVILEIGNSQYIFKLNNFKFKKLLHTSLVSSYDIELVKKYGDHKHYYSCPLSIRGARIKYDWHFRNRKINYIYMYDSSFTEAVLKTYNNSEINLPILGNTKIAALINGKEIWIELNTYLSSLKNDKNIDIPMTDVQKAEIHGFDKKLSFRHPIK